jgi:hypothetical protein
MLKIWVVGQSISELHYRIFDWGFSWTYLVTSGDCQVNTGKVASLRAMKLYW